MFSGTLRDNLDPFGVYSDAEVWSALERSQLSNLVSGMPLGLHSVVEEQGRNFSLGQRQLICLGRALLRKAPILCIDEATASVDHATDALLQHALRTFCAGCTILTVAHRISTILDSDVVLVLHQGQLVEMGSPSELLASTSSRFAQLVQQSQHRQK